MTATVPPGTNQLQLCQQQVQQWQASLVEYRNSSAAAELPLPQDSQWQAMLGGGALYAYAAAATNPSGSLIAAPQASGFAAQQPAACLPVTGLPPPPPPPAVTAGGSAQRARAVTFSLPEKSKTAGESTSDGTSPTESTQVSEGAVTPSAAAGTQQAILFGDPAAAAAAAYVALADTANAQEDAGRANKRAKAPRTSTGQGARTAQINDDDDAKLRRKQSNRESARRSRQRKEEEEREVKQRLEASEKMAGSLRAENDVLRQQLQQMTAIIDGLNQDRTALATQVRSLGGAVRAELMAPIAIPQVPPASDMTAMQQQQWPQQPQQQNIIAGAPPAGVVAGFAGTCSLHQMPAVTGAAAVPWQPAGTFSSGHT